MKGRTMVLALVAVAAVVAGVLFWRSQLTQEPQAPVAVPAPPPPPQAAASEPGIQHPVEPAALPPLAGGEIAAALVELLGRSSVASFLQTDEFPRRFVATVDNLGRAHAPPIMWPVTPTPGRFTVEEQGGAVVIAKDNSARYTPFVLLVETVDVPRAVQLYTRMYPLLQQAYQELGYPRGYFNDRLVEVIDLLLATPAVEYPLQVQLVEVKGSVPSVRPWVRYEYTDPRLESLAAGQKILLRVGAVNQKRLKSKLTELRSALGKPVPAR